MAYVSELTGKPVTDIQGRPMGVVSDIIARQRHEFLHPVVEAIEVEHKGKKMMIPYSDVAALLSVAVPLNCSFDRLDKFDLLDQYAEAVYQLPDYAPEPEPAAGHDADRADRGLYDPAAVDVDVGSVGEIQGAARQGA